MQEVSNTMSSDKRTDTVQTQEGQEEQQDKESIRKRSAEGTKGFLRDMAPVIVGMIIVLTGQSLLGGWRRRRAAKKLAQQQQSMLPASED